jgi:hypothetical protein
MKDETDRVAKGMKYEGKGQFYHDALTLMECTRTKTYMNTPNLLRYWVLLLDNLHQGTRYHNWIPGDSPERMPLDETLDMDIQASARYYIAIASHLQNDDQLKFLFSTQKRSPVRIFVLLILTHGGGVHHLSKPSKTVRNGRGVWKR